MKFTIERDHLIAGLGHVLNVISQRASMPILGNVLIVAEGGGDRISLTTTNLDLGEKITIKANVEVGGKITLPGRRLQAIVKALPEQMVQMDKFSDTQVKIVSGSSQFKIMGMPAKDFPLLPDIGGAPFIELKQKDFASMLKEVAYAQSMDEARYVLNGVFVYLEPSKISMIATDGRRLAIVEKATETQPNSEQGFIIPAKTVAELQKLSAVGESVKLSFNGRHVVAEFDISAENAEKLGLMQSIYLVSKVVEGQFPKYRQVVPKDADQRVKLDRELFLNAVQRCSLVASEKNNAIALKFRENALEINASSSDFGDCHELIAIEYTGPEVAVTFNPQYLIDPLKALTQDRVYFEFKDKLSPGVIKSTESFLCVIMPLRS